MDNLPKKELELKKLLDPEPLKPEFEIIEPVLPAIANVYKEDLRSDLPERLNDPLEKERFAIKFDLLADLLEEAEDVETLETALDSKYQAVHNQYEENMKVVYEKTKPFERTARALHLLYENASGQANVFIMPADAGKFADSRNPKHFEIMRSYLRKQFYKFQMEDSPFYLTYIGDIGGRSAMHKMAEIAEETQAIAVVDIKDKKSAQAVLEYADTQLKITGSQAKLGHLLLPGTWLYADKAENIEFVSDEHGRLRRRVTKMAVPAAAAVTGKLMETAPGVYITGLEAEPIINIDGVRVQYDLERIDSKEFALRGLVQIIDNGSIQGGSTPNRSDKPELGKFAKVDAANALMKDIIQYCNNKAFGKWGKKYEGAFKKEIENYLNRRIKCELIEGYTIDHIFYDTDEEIVDIEITVNFFEVADEFAIGLRGGRNGIDAKREG